MKDQEDDDSNRFHDESKNASILKNEGLKPQSWVGYVFAFLSAFLAAIGAVLIKLCEEEAAKIVLLRCVFQYLVLLPPITLKKQVIVQPDLKTNVLLFLRGLCGPISMMSCAGSLERISVGDSVAVFYTYPALVYIFACIWLKEKCGIFNIVLMIITAVGLVLITQPTFIFHNATVHQQTTWSIDHLIGVGLSVLGAVVTALATVIVRKLGPAIPFTVSMFYYAWEGVVMIVAFLAIDGNLELPCLQKLLLVIAANASIFLAQSLTTLALQRERAGPVTLIKTTEVMISFLFQYFVFGVAPTVLSGIGAALILSCSVAIGIKQCHTNKLLPMKD